MDTFHMYRNPNDQNIESQIITVLAGDTHTARQRLITAVQCLGYQIVSDNPLRARRNARNGAQAQMSVNILDYQCKLEIHLSSLSEYATRVVLDYDIHQGSWCTPQPTLRREAEAIVALAQRLSQKTDCSTCGALLTGESRFCRSCGTSLQLESPAELEVLRLTAGLRTGFDLIGAGTLLLFALMVVLFVGIKFEVLTVFAIFAIPSGILGILAFLAGFRRLAVTLKETDKNSELRLPPSRPNYPDNKPPSVIEGTTKLLHQ